MFFITCHEGPTNSVRITPDEAFNFLKVVSRRMQEHQQESTSSADYLEAIADALLDAGDTGGGVPPGTPPSGPRSVTGTYKQYDAGSAVFEVRFVVLGTDEEEGKAGGGGGGGGPDPEPSDLQETDRDVLPPVPDDEEEDEDGKGGRTNERR